MKKKIRPKYGENLREDTPLFCDADGSYYKEYYRGVNGDVTHRIVVVKPGKIERII